MAAGEKEGIAGRTLKRARKRAGVNYDRSGFGKGTVWSLGPHSGQSGQGSDAGPIGPNEARMEHQPSVSTEQHRLEIAS